MEKFNYTKWVTDHKHGLIIEQAGTGSATGSAPLCYYCEDTGSIGGQMGSLPALYNSGYQHSNGYSWNPSGICWAGSYGNFGNLNPNDPQLIATCSLNPGNPGTGSSGCDTTACDAQWLPSNMNWPNKSNFDCTGQNTFQGLIDHLTPQLGSLGQQAPNNTGNYSGCWNNSNNSYCTSQPNNGLCLGPCAGGHYASVNSWQDISDVANIAFGAGSVGQPQKGQWKRKYAKIKWASCMTGSCCTTSESTGNKNESKINKEMDYKLLKKTIKETLQDLDEHPQSWTHTHTVATCWGCENTIPSSHTTEWVLNPAAGNVNYCQDPQDPTPIQSNWWADDQQWVIDNICAYQTPITGCTQADFDVNGTAAQNANMVNAWVGAAGPSNFLNNMWNGYQLKGCNFLNKRLSIHQNHLATGLGGPQGNKPMGPTWIPQKQSKVDFLIAILNSCGC